MVEPETFVAFAPFGRGVMLALFYFARDADVYGWWIGARDGEFHSAYFGLESFYTTHGPRFYATAGSDLQGGWRQDHAAHPPALDRPLPLPGDLLHELDRLQGAFVAEWLVFGDEAGAGERESYERMGLILGPVAVRSSRLGGFDKSQPTWIRRSHRCDMHVVDYLRRHLQLDWAPAFEGLSS